MAAASAGFHRFLPQDQVQLRRDGAKLNPRTFRPARNSDVAPDPVYSTADAERPANKTNAIMRANARESDRACADGTNRRHAQHPQRVTGVHASHAMQKVPGHDDEHGRKPDPMHTGGGEATALTVMVMGGTASMYSVQRLPEVAKWEIRFNKRWQRELGPYERGMSTQCSLP